MTVIGHIWSISWRLGETSNPPDDMPKILGEIFVPVDHSGSGARKPTVLHTVPIPDDYCTACRALDADHAPMPAEKLARIRQGRLRRRVENKYPLFVDQFFAEELDKKKTYYVDGNSDVDAVLEKRREERAVRINFLTAHPNQLIWYWKRKND